MANITRLLRTTNKPNIPPTSYSTTTSMFTSINSYNAKFMGKGKMGSEEKLVLPTQKSKLKSTFVVKACVNRELTALGALVSFLNYSYGLVYYHYKGLLRRFLLWKAWKLKVQLFIEQGIVNCRFFTLFAVVGSLLGSVLCFLEGCFLILRSCFQYLNLSSPSSEESRLVQLLFEAIDMFLVGTAMLIFGVGIYVIFVGTSKDYHNESPKLPRSNFFGLFHLKAIPTWMEMDSISEAKSKIGHTILLLLQVGMLEKFKSIPLTSSLDLACFAAALFVSSACTFLLSKLSFTGGNVVDRNG